MKLSVLEARWLVASGLAWATAPKNSAHPVWQAEGAAWDAYADACIALGIHPQP